MKCPFCGSKRVIRYGRGTDRYCKACTNLYEVIVKAIPVCFKCEKPILDYTKAVLMGNNKEKHIRCRRTTK